MDFRNVPWANCKYIFSKLISKYHGSTLIRPSRISQNTFYNNNTCESSITTIYQSKISKINFNELSFIAYKNDESCHFAVRIASGVPTSFYCMCVVSFYFSLFSYFFAESTTYWVIEVSFVNTYNKAFDLFLGF